MNILVTGATGFVGQTLISKLLEEKSSDTISVLIFPGEKIPLVISDNKITVYYGDITNKDAVKIAVHNKDIVIHLAGLISYWKRDIEKLVSVNVHGVDNIVKACLEHKVKRLVHISSVGAVGFKKDGSLADETTEYNWSEKFPYMTTKKQGEDIILDAVKNMNLNAVVLNPASIMGPGDPNVLSPHNKLYYNIYSSPFFFGSFSGGLAVVDVRDLCNGIIKALSFGESGERFLIIGDNVPYSRVLRSIGKVAEKPVYPVSISPFLLVLAGFFTEMISGITGKRPLLTAAYGRLSGWFAYYSNNKSKEILGMEYRDIDETIEDGCQFFVEKYLD